MVDAKSRQSVKLVDIIRSNARSRRLMVHSIHSFTDSIHMHACMHAKNFDVPLSFTIDYYTVHVPILYLFSAIDRSTFQR